jgi:hypothetical protein
MTQVVGYIRVGTKAQSLSRGNEEVSLVRRFGACAQSGSFWQPDRKRHIQTRATSVVAVGHDDPNRRDRKTF